MPSLFNFSTLSIPAQTTAAKAFGPKSITKFRLTTSFTLTSEKMAYAMTSGTILLQKQTGSTTKVNLILKPDDNLDLKVNVKFIIYRGLKITDFLTNGNITATSTNVKTGGTELLDAMQLIQQQRAPADQIPVQALFGHNLTPAIDVNLDTFFYQTSAPSSQLFKVYGGMALGKFANGDAGIEIVLKNPEYFPDVQMAQTSFHELDVTAGNNIADKWEREKVRHFIDPAAFYGLQRNIDDGIGYRDNNGDNIVAQTDSDVYENILLPFFNNNKIYLDIRNENGYSYNFYDNYNGTGANATKQLRIGNTTASLLAVEYNNSGWPIHIVTGIATSATENHNTFYAALRVNDNEKPLLAGNSKILIQGSAPDTDQVVKFLDERFLLPSPVPNPLPEFTEAFQLRVPNYVGPSSHIQIATLISLKYIKQIRLDDPADTFPAENASDHLFGPILTKIPWDSDDAIQWIGSNHYKYYDGLNQGFAFVTIDQSITGLNPSAKAITIGIGLAAQVMEKVEIINAGTSVNTGVYNVKGVSASGSSATVITVRETFPTALQSGDTLRLKIEVAVTIDYPSNRLIAKGIDLTSEPGYAVGQYIRLYTKKGDFPLRYTISSVAFTSGNTEITISQQISKEGYGAIMETGIVSETDVASGPNTPDVDRVIFYAAPQHYFQKTGIKDTSYFNYKGALAQGKSLLSVLRDRIPGFEIEKFSLRPQGLSPVATLAYPDATVARENLLMLGLDKAEFESLKTAALASLSIFHLQMIKLVPQGNRKRDLDYEAYYEYHAVISGLDSNGVYAEAAPSTPVVVYSRDGLIFTSASFATAEEVKAAETNQEEMFHLNIFSQYSAGNSYGEYNKHQRSGDINSTYQYLCESLGASLKIIVDDFENAVSALITSNFRDEIEKIIISKGTLLLDTARSDARNPNSLLFHKEWCLIYRTSKDEKNSQRKFNDIIWFYFIEKNT